MNVYLQPTYALLHLPLPPDGSATVTCSWALVKSKALLTRGEGTLEQAALACEGYRLAVALPSRQGMVTEVNLPTRNHQQRRAALPYMLQPQIAEPVAHLHLAWRARGQQLQVVGMNRDTLAGYQQQLAAVGLQPHWITLDALLLPWQTGQAYLWASAAGCVLRYGEHQVLACDTALLGDYMPLVQADEPATTGAAPATLSLILDGPAVAQVKLVMGQTKAHKLMPVALQPNPVNPIAALLAHQFKPSQAINLLPRTSRAWALGNIDWRRWRWPLILGSGLALAWLVQLWLQNQQLQWQWRQLQQYQTDLYQTAVPAATRVAHPVDQLKAKLARLPPTVDGGDLLNLLTVYHQLLQQQPRAAPMVLQQLDFQPGHLTLTLQVQAELQLTPAIQQAWPAVQIALQQSRTSNDVIQAVLVLTLRETQNP